MQFETIAPFNGKLEIELPSEMAGHRVEVIIIDLDAKPLQKFKDGDEARAYFKAISIDTRGFKFDRDEANER